MTFALVVATAFAVSAALPARGSAGIGAPAIWSERPDYAPGETVTLLGDGWGVGEVVHINVNDDAGQTWSRDVDVTADLSGNVSDQFTIPDWLVAIYTVTATAPSGTATATFTDGNVKARTNASGFTFRLDWTRHSGTNPQPEPDCDAPANRQSTGFNPAVGFSGGAQFSDGVPSSSSEVLAAADVASNGFVFIGWSGETSGDLFLTRTDPHEICVPGDFTGSRTYVASYEANVPPAVAAENASSTVNEGQTATNSGTFSDANALDTVTLSASVGTITQSGTHSGTWSWSFATTDGPDESQTVTITATDNHGLSSTTTFDLTVNNVAPTVALTSAPASANEGETKAYTYSISDPGQDTVQSVSTSCGLNGTKSNASNTDTSGSFDCTFPDGAASSTVSVQATDSDGDAGNTATQAVTVANVAPTVTLIGANAADEGDTHSYSYTVSDPGDEVFSRDAQSCGDNATLSNDAFNPATGAGSFDCTFPDGPAGSTVSVTVSDGDGGSDSDSISVEIANVAPTVSLSGAENVNEGSTHTYSFTVSDPGDEVFSRDAQSCGDNGTLSDDAFNPATGAGSFDCSFPDGPAGSSVSVTVSDGDGGSDDDSISVEIANVAPTVSLSGANAADEGDTHSYIYTVSDPGDEVFALDSASCGAGNTLSNQAFNPVNGAGSFDCTFADGLSNPSVSVAISDGDGGSDSDSISVTVSNVAPVVSMSGPASADEGQTKHYTFSTADPGDEVFSVDSASCGAGNTLSNQAFNSATGTGSFDCTFADGPAGSTVSVTVSDGDGGSDSDSISVEIANVAPTVSLSGANAADEGGTHSYSYTVSDPGDEVFSRDAQSCGDNGTLSNDAFNPATGAGSFDCSFPDGPAGSTVSVTVSDGDGGSDDDSINVTISNVAPTVSLTGAENVNEGSTHTYSFTVSDPGQDTFSVVAGYPTCGTSGSVVTGSLSTNASGGSFQCSFPDGPATTHVAIKVEDSDHASDTDSEDVVIVAVANVDPVVTLSGPAGADEGDTEHYSFTTSDQGTETFALDGASCGAGNTLSNPAFTPATGAGSFDCTFADGLSNPSVSVTVSDGDGGSGSDSISVTVANVAPIVTLSGPTSVASSSSHTYTFTISDPGEDSQAYAAGYPTCGANGTVSAPTITSAGGSFNCTFGVGPATSTVAVKVNDGEDDSNEDSKLVTIAPPNHPPTVDAGPNQSGAEGSAIGLDGTVSDQDGDSFTVNWTYTGVGVDAGATCSFGDATAVDTTITCTDDGTYTATLTATDSKGASSSDETTVTVSNANPGVTAVNETPPPYAMGSTVAVSANFTDAGTNDTHRTPPGGNCTVSWDDGTPSSTGIVSEASGSGNCSASHVYSGAGVYTVTITVTDDDGGSGSATVQVVVYDPSAGFITGGGWINVAPGSYPAGPALSGRANFGFTSKYKKGATVPTGETEFNFQVADFRFHSSTYQWLVVSGYKAQYKGTGEVNGAPGYDFRLTAYDGGVGGPGNTGQDRFRIKITEHSTGVVVFDNRLGSSDDMDAANPQAISGGSIVIHKA